jgi:hypothetical protein
MFKIISFAVDNKLQIGYFNSLLVQLTTLKSHYHLEISNISKPTFILNNLLKDKQPLLFFDIDSIADIEKCQLKIKKDNWDIGIVKPITDSIILVNYTTEAIEFLRNWEKDTSFERVLKESPDLITVNIKPQIKTWLKLRKN